jgi:response regulator RpfG family c-di-GMP phosphodiesterase
MNIPSSLQYLLTNTTEAFAGTATPAGNLLGELLATGLILAEEWQRLPGEEQSRLAAISARDVLLAELIALGLLTEYQGSRVRVGKAFGLVLGNYRVLDCLGRGGMGVVFRAEHSRMRRQVAVKVLAGIGPQESQLVQRFLGEVRAVAVLNHPNIVTAFDAGEVTSNNPDLPVLHYFVMEYVPGQDLESLVYRNGPLDPARACDLARQIAEALAEAHRHGLIHRDLKPSNVLVTPEWQAKLLDFGLAQQSRHRWTEPGTVLGTLGYMAPEQAQDSSAVDARADLYSLGCTLFFMLTGRDPFAGNGPAVQELLARLVTPPPSVRSVRPELPVGLDELVGRLMAVRPAERPPAAQVVSRALLSFLGTPVAPAEAAALIPPVAELGRVPRVLIVDDETEIRVLCRLSLRGEHLDCQEASSTAEALATARAEPPDLLLLDLQLPDGLGVDVLAALRADPAFPNLKVVVMSGALPGDEVAQVLQAGADDYLTKPFSPLQLRARVKAALRLKAAQDRSDALRRRLSSANSELARHLDERECELSRARGALVLALAKLVEQRSSETGSHLVRMQRFCRILADAAAADPAFAGRIEPCFPAMLESCAPLHDIGKVALPDHILLKPGRLDAQERLLMQAHPVLAADTLDEVARHSAFSEPFLRMARDIARHHHERWDGTGYPDRLAGEAIPLAARIVAVADVYDALRSRRVYKPALSHSAALDAILSGSDGQFDPALLRVLRGCADQFDRVYRELAD